MIRVCQSCGQKNRVGGAHITAETRCGKCKAALGPVAEPIEADTESFEDVRLHATTPVHHGVAQRFHGGTAGKV